MLSSGTGFITPSQKFADYLPAQSITPIQGLKHYGRDIYPVQLQGITLSGTGYSTLFQKFTVGMHIPSGSKPLQCPTFPRRSSERDGVCNPVPKVCRLPSCAKHFTNPRPQTLRTGYISRPAPLSRKEREITPERDGVCNPVPKVCRLPSCAKHYTNPRPQTLRTGCISRPAPSRFSALPFPATRFHAQETRHKYPAIPVPGLSKLASPYRPGAKHPSIYAACRRVWLCRNRFDL